MTNLKKCNVWIKAQTAKKWEGYLVQTTFHEACLSAIKLIEAGWDVKIES